eukprot:4556078-Amphidinium_carterae.1
MTNSLRKEVFSKHCEEWNKLGHEEKLAYERKAAELGTQRIEEHRQELLHVRTALALQTSRAQAEISHQGLSQSIANCRFSQLRRERLMQ